MRACFVPVRGLHTRLLALRGASLSSFFSDRRLRARVGGKERVGAGGWRRLTYSPSGRDSSGAHGAQFTIIIHPETRAGRGKDCG